MATVEDKVGLIAERFSEALQHPENAVYADWVVHMGHSGISTRFDAADNLKKYMLGWHTHDNFGRFPSPLDEVVVQRSAAFHSDVFSFYFGNEDNPFSVPGYGDRLNAQDQYFLFDAYRRFGAPEKLRVLDFGAGYGRTLTFLSANDRLIEYCAVDGNENSYCVQYLYRNGAREARLKNFRLAEHFLPEETGAADSPVLSHIPTWAMPGLPDQHFDIILCNQVLPEVSARTYEAIIPHLHRVLKLGGVWFIRDHGLNNMPGHRYHDDKILTSLGYVKEYEPFLVDFQNIHGVPRIYRKSNPSLSPHKRPEQIVDEYQGPDVFFAEMNRKKEAAAEASAPRPIPSEPTWRERLRSRMRKAPT